MRESNRLGKWSAEKNIQLIRAFRLKPVLWDTQHEMYYNKPAKPAAWIEIGAALGVSPERCKFKMTTLMSGFRREKAKLIHALRNRYDVDRRLRNAWYAFKEMAFLMDKENERCLQGSGQDIETFSCDESRIKRILNNIVRTEDVNKRKRLLMQRKIVPLVVEEAHDESSDDCNPVCEERYETVESNKDTGSPILQSTSRIIDGNPAYPSLGHSQASSQLKETTDEEITFFANFIASKMKKYSNITKNAVQKEICDIVFKADQNYYETISDEKYTIVYDDPLDDVEGGDDNKANKCKRGY